MVVKLSDDNYGHEVHEDVEHRVVRGQDDQIDVFAGNEDAELEEAENVGSPPILELPVVIRSILHH